MVGEPAQIGKYTIIGTLGRGAMGVVYQGQDPEIGRIVALKTLRSITSEHFPDKDTAIERFKSEARSAGNLRHPNIVTVFDAHIDNDIPYIVMDYVEGKTLASIVSDHGKLPPKKSIHYLKQIASGLDAAHKSGVIHRDIKPNNLVVDLHDHAYILDFGVAKLTESFSQTTEADDDEPIMGTPGYMSPEQIMSDPLDHRSDLFSFAIVAYECFAGKRPFVGEDFREMVRNIVQEEPIPLSIPSPELPLALEAEFLKALSKERDNRHNSATEMIAAFEKALGSLMNKKDTPGAGGRQVQERKRQPSEWKSLGDVAGGEPLPKTEDAPAGSSAAANNQLIKVKPHKKTSSALTMSEDTMFRPSQDRNVLPGDMFAHEESLLGRKRKSSFSFSKAFVLVVSLVLMCVGAYFGLFYEEKADTELVATKENLPKKPNTVDEIQALKKIDAVTYDAAKPLQQMSDKEIVSVLLNEKTPEEDIFTALRIARERGIPDAVDASVVPLEHDSYAVRIETIKFLSSQKDKRIVPILVKRLDDHDPLVRIQAAKALGSLGSRNALGYLTRRYVQEVHGEVKRSLKAAIEKINGYPMAG